MFKKHIAIAIISMISFASIGLTGAGIVGAYNDNILYNASSVAVTQAIDYNKSVNAVTTTHALTQSGNQIVVEDADVTDVRTASGDYL
jgi:hypothetical protein